MSRRCLVALLALAACNGAQPNLDGLGEALVIGMLVIAAAFTVGLYACFKLWRALLRSLRDARQPGTDAGPATRAWCYALTATAVHIGLIALLSERSFGDGEPARIAMFLSLVPLALLGWATWLAAIRGRRWPVLAMVAMIAAALPFLIRQWQMRPLAELPGRIVQLGQAPHYACARTSTGEVVCNGVNWSGQRGDGNEDTGEAPTRVRGIDDAVELALSDEFACVLRRTGTVSCWGGKDVLPVPGSPYSPWDLPDGADAVGLAVTPTQIVTLGAAGVLRGWPDPTPHDLPRSRLVVGDESLPSSWLCSLDETDSLTCWAVRTPERRHRFALAAARSLALEGRDEIVCATEPGRVRCFDLEAGVQLPPRELADVRELVALEQRGYFCALAGGQVHCWRANTPSRVLGGLGLVEHIFAAGDLLCAESGATRTCDTPAGDSFADRAATLLAHDRAP